MDIWVVGTSNQLFLRDAKTETNFPKKGFTGKTPLFMIGLFVVAILHWLLTEQF